MAYNQSLSVNDCAFNANEAESVTGVVGSALFWGVGFTFFEPYAPVSSRIMTISNSDFAYNAGYGTIVAERLDDVYCNDQVDINDCRIEENEAPEKGCVYLSELDVEIDNCLFADNVAQYIIGFGDRECSLSLKNSTMSDNIAGDAAETAIIRYTTSTPHPLQVHNTSITYHNVFEPIVGDDPDRNDVILYTNIYDNYYPGGSDWGNLPEYQSDDSNMSVDPFYVSRIEDNYNLRWDSPLVDTGYQSAEDDVEWDLTKPDIGWHTIYEPEEIPSTGPIDVGWYYVDNSSVYVANEVVIPAGTVIKVAPGANLEIVSEMGLQQPSLTIGDLEGQRTAIVGKMEHAEENVANMIQIGCDDITRDAVTSLSGVLFNYAPVTGLNVNNTAIEFSSPEVQLQNYQVKWIKFKNCSGSLADFIFHAEGPPYDDWPFVNSLAKVSCVNSAVDIIGCTFRPPTSSEGWALEIYGSKAKSDIVVQENTFKSEEGLTEPVTPLLLNNAPVKLIENRFGNHEADQDFEVTIINQHNSTNTMKEDARNAFHGDTSDPLILQDGGELNLYCGYNDFRQQKANPQGSWAKYVQDQNITVLPVYRDWTHNFWGDDDCLTPMEETIIITQTLVPDWVEDEMNILPACNWGFVGCDPFLGDGGEQLLAAGKAAEQTEDFSTAVGMYTQLLAEYSESIHANEAALRIKAIGLDSVFGADNCETLQSTLLMLSDTTLNIDPELSTLEQSAAWCIHARHIDPGYAETELLTLRNSATTSTSIKCLDLALLEILTYPPPNSLNDAPTVDQRIAEAIYNNERVEDLLNYGRSMLREERRRSNSPRLPHKVELLGCYPNPFNPSTTISYRLDQPGRIEIQVYNLRGQLVATLLDNRQDAGIHQAVFQPDGLAAGLYFISIRTSASTLVEKVLFVK